MENYSIIIFILAVMIGLSALADRVRLPYPILLIVAGIGLGFIPHIPQVELNPDVVFLIFLPPLLQDSAFNVQVAEFRANLRTIGTLAFSLVFLTASGIAVVAHYVIPGMTWPLSFTLGAILAATDAVAALSITKVLGLPHKTSTILEGESLINDASAMVAYRFAVAAVTGAVFVFWKASVHFVIVAAGGAAVGIAAGRVITWILRRVHRNHPVAIGFLLLIPFVTYLFAETLDVSGVIAVVLLGLRLAELTRREAPENLKQEARSVWNTIVYLLNGLVFILIGLEFPHIALKTDRTHWIHYIAYGFLITIVALVIRMARVFLQQVNLYRSFRRRRVAEAALLDARTSFIISWSGMRGIVSLALALGLPETLPDGSPFPMRDPIIFISVVVVLFTLIGQGLTLPWVVRVLKGATPAEAPGAAEA